MDARSQTPNSPRGSLYERRDPRNGPLGGHTLEDLQKRVSLLEDTFRAGFSFGVPVGIDNLGGVSGQHIGNMRGAWVQQDVTALNTNVTFSHSLGLQAPTGVVNVRWLLFGLRHDNNTAGPGDTLSLLYIGGTVTGDSIQLAAFAGGGRTVDGSHPLKVTLFFVPADG